MRISVVTPSLNQGRFIEDAIRSVLDQGVLCEHIVIDGGSTDGTVEVLRRYPSVRWISESDRGQSSALNRGFRMVNGGIVGWLNADDLLEPGALQVVADFFQCNPEAVIVHGRALLIDERGEVIGESAAPAPALEGLVEYWRFPNPVPPQPAVFFRRPLLDAVGLLDERYHYAMDYDLWLRVIAAGYAWYTLDRVLARFRLHPQSKGVSGVLRHLDETEAVSRGYWGPRCSRGYWRRWVTARAFRAGWAAILAIQSVGGERWARAARRLIRRMRARGVPLDVQM